MSDLVVVAVIDGAFVVPGGEDGLDSFAQLLVDTGGEWLARLSLGDLFELNH